MLLFCSKCGLPKPETEFFRRSNTRGYNYYCKLCDNSRKLVQNLSQKALEAKRLRGRILLSENISSERRRKMEVYYKQRDTPKWRATKARSQEKRRTNVRLSENNLSGIDIEVLLKVQNNKCAKCLLEFGTKNKYTIDHILPVSMGGKLSFRNTQLLCKSCNSSKGTNITKYRKDVVYDFTEVK